MELKRNRADVALYIVCLTTIISLLVAFFLVKQTPATRVDVYYDNVLIRSMNLSEDEVYVLKKENFPLLLGDLTIEIKDGRARVQSETSPKHYCSRMGFQKDAGTAIICAPNSVRVVIVGDSAVDYQPGGNIS